MSPLHKEYIALLVKAVTKGVEWPSQKGLPTLRGSEFDFILDDLLSLFLEQLKYWLTLVYLHKELNQRAIIKRGICAVEPDSFRDDFYADLAVDDLDEFLFPLSDYVADVGGS